MARLDTGWHEHPKILGLGLAGMGLHAWSISYCDATRSDGFVPNGAWPALRGTRQTVQKLVRSGVWVPAEGGYRVHHYTVYNRTRAQIETQLAEDRKRKSPEFHRNPAGTNRDSGGTPRAPGPGPLSTSMSRQKQQPEHPARARAREVALSPELQVEHERRLKQERAAATPAHIFFSQDDDADKQA